MTEPTSTTLLSGWIQPGECYFCGDDLSLRLRGTFAGEEARISLCLADARRHGFPAVPNVRITRVLGNWLRALRVACGQPQPPAPGYRDYLRRRLASVAPALIATIDHQKA